MATTDSRRSPLLPRRREEQPDTGQPGTGSRSNAAAPQHPAAEILKVLSRRPSLKAAGPLPKEGYFLPKKFIFVSPFFFKTRRAKAQDSARDFVKHQWQPTHQPRRVHFLKHLYTPNRHYRMR